MAWDYSKIDGFQHVRSTVRNVVLELDPDIEIPSLENLWFEDRMVRFLITVPGRGPVCFRCQGIGHTRQSCNEVYCRHCLVYGKHSTEACSQKNSYAGKAKESQAKESQEVFDPPMDGQQSNSEKDVGSGKQVGDERTQATAQSGEEAKMEAKSQSQPGDSSDSEASTAWGSVAEDPEDREHLFSSGTSLFNMVKESDPDAFQTDGDTDSVKSDRSARGTKQVVKRLKKK